MYGLKYFMANKINISGGCNFKTFCCVCHTFGITLVLLTLFFLSTVGFFLQNSSSLVYLLKYYAMKNMPQYEQ